MVAKIIDFVAGVVGGSTGILVGQPFDVVKVRLQTSNMYSGVFDCAKQMIKAEGVSSFYRGLVPPLLGVGGLNAVLFGTYAATKRLLQRDQEADLSLGQVFTCGSVAGLTCCLVTTPTELLKCREQIYLKPEQVAEGTSTIRCFRNVVNARGYAGLFTGFWITALRDVPSYGAYFLTYDAITRYWVGPDASMNLETFSKMLVAGAAAGIAGWSPPVYQVDVIKTRMQTQDLVRPQYKNSFDCLQQVYRAEGPTVLWRGLGSAMIRAIPVNAVTFAVYELTLFALADHF